MQKLACILYKHLTIGRYFSHIEQLLVDLGTVHGLAFWFDVAFIGTNATVWLSTAPTQPLTHWYQVSEQPTTHSQCGFILLSVWYL